MSCEMKKYLIAIAGLLSLGSYASATTVESIFPTASVSALAEGFLTRYVDLILQFWPLFIGVAVVFMVVYKLIRMGKNAIHGKVGR